MEWNMLNGREMMERLMIKKGKEDVLDKQIQPHGIDLTVIRIEMITGTGSITKDRVHLPKLHSITSDTILRHNEPIGWTLLPGQYAVTFDQGCYVPEDTMMLVTHKSSLLRCGAIITSGVFDAGFETDAIGAYLIVNHEIFIEKGAAIGVAINYESDTNQSYEGKYQGDVQRREGK